MPVRRISHHCEMQPGGTPTVPVDPPSIPARSMAYSSNVPKRDDLLWPTLRVLEDLGGSATIGELSDHLASWLQLPDEVLDELHGDGPQSEVDYRAAWARSNLKLIGAVENTARGNWAITRVGRDIQSEESLRNLVKKERARRYGSGPKPASRSEDEERVSENGSDWKEALLSVVRDLDPSAFERLCQRILRESGFTKVEVTGRSGDGGIDGAGVLRVNLISFHVRFQCKRYAGSVNPREIRDFRGAMVGRADKGLFITTGHFTKGAEQEATRDGAPAIDLIDGLSLCNHLKELELGVVTRMVETVTIKQEFFEGL